jgi:peptidyl-prolyl cis-trans isomerase D
MVKPFNDFVFENETGDLGVVKTNFGYHVIKITNQSPAVRKADLAIVQRQVVPSDATYQDIYSSSVQFRSEATSVEEFRDQYNEVGLTPRFATEFDKSTKDLPGLENAREIIRWAFENEEGTVSQIFDLSDKYIVAALTDVNHEGIAEFDDVKSEIEVIVSKQKKLEKVLETVQEQTGGLSDIQAISDALDQEVLEAENVRLVNPYINNVGLEPTVVAKAVVLNEGDLSEPFIGQNNVFVISVREKDVPEDLDVASAKFRLKYMMQSRVAFQGYEALKEHANIEDNRIRFY